jgi:hypothetical protein
MHRDTFRVIQRVKTAWEVGLHQMEKMYQASVVRSDLGEIFSHDPRAHADEVGLLVGPVVFNVPEKPTHRDSNLYIVVKGWLRFEGPNFKDTPLKTKNFGTEVGYFRLKEGVFHHVYGAHYDMDDERPGHPVFHAQVSPQVEFADHMKAAFRLEGDVENSLKSLIGIVRTPSAQMDVFAVLTQICADHLLWRDSSVEVKQAFNAVREAGSFMIGAGHRFDFLRSEQAIQCYRSPHWYDASLLTPVQQN